MTMNKKYLVAAMAGLVVSVSALAAQQTASQDPGGTPASASNQETGLAAWAKVFEVFSHPRCANCHVDDGRPMWSGEHYGETLKHPMFVGGDPDLLLGNPGLMCNTCHMEENSPKLHGPPGNDVWHLPPKEMVWWERGSAEICQQIQDPARNGGRSLAEIQQHVAEDSLVAWGWNPGPGREPAPYSAEETAQYIAAWSSSGAPCPTSAQ